MLHQELFSLTCAVIFPLAAAGLAYVLLLPPSRSGERTLPLQGRWLRLLLVGLLVFSCAGLGMSLLR